MNVPFLAGEYLEWRLKSKNLHGIHSPFMYSFMKDCLYRNVVLKEFEAIENERKRLLSDTSVVAYNDPGAGSRTGKRNSENEPICRKVKSIAKTSLQKPKYSRMLFRLANYFKSGKILELGTSLGITSSYLSLCDEKCIIDTIEGAEPVAAIAREVFQRIGIQNINLHHGKFSDVLPRLLNNNSQYEMVFIDGDHHGDHLLNYFNELVKHTHTNGVIVIDDIRWTHSMLKAWKQITKHEAVTAVADLFTLGIVFMNPSLSKETFYIRF